jgi:hypothetical protein
LYQVYLSLMRYKLVEDCEIWSVFLERLAQDQPIEFCNRSIDLFNPSWNLIIWTRPDQENTWNRLIHIDSFNITIWPEYHNEFWSGIFAFFHRNLQVHFGREEFGIKLNEFISWYMENVIENKKAAR